ncbi:MAG: TcpQ domain-containing protein [Pseudobdellovibrionaceae bacterium]
MSIRTLRVATSNLLAVGTLACCALSLSSPALAGFEWTPPPSQEKVAPSPAPNGPLTPEMDSLPIAPVTPVDQAPVVEMPVQPQAPEQTQIPAATPDSDYLPVPGAKTSSGLPDEPQILSNVPTEPHQKAPTPQQEPAGAANVISGFGSDIPLALALRDIVPPSYPYAFEKSEYAGVRISWNGGLPWIKVLENSLTPVGLKATLNSDTLYISAKTDPEQEPVPIEMQQQEPMSAVQEPLKLSTSEPALTEGIIAPATTTPKQEAPLQHAAGDVTTQHEWKARPGSTLRQTLETWSKIANVELEWMNPYDFPIANAYNYVGTFNEATESLISSFGRENPKPRGRFFPNEPDGPSVLMIN